MNETNEFVETTNHSKKSFLINLLLAILTSAIFIPQIYLRVNLAIFLNHSPETFYKIFRFVYSAPISLLEPFNNNFWGSILGAIISLPIFSFGSVAFWFLIYALFSKLSGYVLKNRSIVPISIFILLLVTFFVVIYQIPLDEIEKCAQESVNSQFDYRTNGTATPIRDMCNRWGYKTYSDSAVSADNSKIIEPQKDFIPSYVRVANIAESSMYHSTVKEASVSEIYTTPSSISLKTSEFLFLKGFGITDPITYYPIINGQEKAQTVPHPTFDAVQNDSKDKFIIQSDPYKSPTYIVIFDRNNLIKSIEKPKYFGPELPQWLGSYMFNQSSTGTDNYFVLKPNEPNPKFVSLKKEGTFLATHNHVGLFQLMMNSKNKNFFAAIYCLENTKVTDAMSSTSHCKLFGVGIANIDKQIFKEVFVKSTKSPLQINWIANRLFINPLTSSTHELYLVDLKDVPF